MWVQEKMLSTVVAIERRTALGEVQVEGERGLDRERAGPLGMNGEAVLEIGDET